jgi:PhzF family phenazine biosynthesis protein
MRQWTVDAFAARPFTGNPACVLEPLDEWPEDGWMQALAKENNQAETAFLLKTGEPGRYGLRWFTPGLEVRLCGHATLASAHVLFAELGESAPRLSFETRRAGVLSVERDGTAYRLDLPADPPVRTPAPEGLAEALGVEPLEVWAGAYLVALVQNETVLRALQPDLAALEPIAGKATEGPGNLMVSAPADPGKPYEIVSRFFAPGSGIPEDPVTGSAHCIVAPLFADKLGRTRIRFHQAFPGRGGDVDAEVRGDRVLLGGTAVTVVESRLRL